MESFSFKIDFSEEIFSYKKKFSVIWNVASVIVVWDCNDDPIELNAKVLFSNNKIFPNKFTCVLWSSLRKKKRI